MNDLKILICRHDQNKTRQGIHLMNPDAFATDAELLQVQMIYPQFLEAFIALACYRFPDPFLSMAQKVQQFLEEVAFPVLRRSVGELPVPPPDEFAHDI